MSPDPTDRPADHSRIRLTVDLETFAGWRAATAGLAVPDDFAVEPPSRSDLPCPPIPPFVAASLAVHAAAEAAICLRVDDGAVRTVVCVSIAGDLAAVLVRAARAVSAAAQGGWAPGGWVQVALLPVTGAVVETLSWMPDVEGPQPSGGSMQLLVVGADDAGLGELASWVTHDGDWRRLIPRADGQVETRPAARAECAAALTAALVRILGDRRAAGG